MPPKPQVHTPTVNIPFPQLLYTSTMGSTVLLLYHFTRLLILLNKSPRTPRRGDLWYLGEKAAARCAAAFYAATVLAALCLDAEWRWVGVP